MTYQFLLVLQISEAYRMLTIGDLNLVIKYYAFNLQLRIEELDRSHIVATDQDQPDTHQLQFLTIIDKYKGYKTANDKELRLARKLVERITQIFQFFKNKSNNQNLLTLIFQRIQQEIEQIFSRVPPDLGELFSYVHLIAKRGGLVRVPAEKRRVFSKSLLREITKAEPKMTPALSLLNIQRRTHSTAQPKHSKTHSTTHEKYKLDDLLEGPFSCLQIQKGPLLRIKESNERQVLRDMLKRNQKILNIMRKEERRSKVSGTQPSEEAICKESTILSEMKPNTAKSLWQGKRKRPGVFPRRRHPTLKENISFMI